jgi:hypothetical protein
MSHLLIFISILCFITLHNPCLSQQMRGNRPKRRPGSRYETNKDETRLMRALTINYPLKFFDGTTPDWKSKASISPSLLSKSLSDRSYIDVGRAQDQEDVWLYENWFYGMEKGVIMESGALNGLTFSTSYMFEKIANWTAVHVGKSSIPLSLLSLPDCSASNVG